MEGQHIQENIPNGMCVPLEHEGAGGTYSLLYGPNLFNSLKSSSRITTYFSPLYTTWFRLVYDL